MQYQKPYYDLFFKSPLSLITSQEFQEQLPKDLKQVVHSYTDNNPAPILDNDALNHWYHNQGQQILITTFEKLWFILSALSQNAMPSHDARHAIFKVPACVLELIDSEEVSGWEGVGIFGGLMHDWGRWSEERIFGRPQGGAIHSRMSFLLAQEFLEDFDIPKEIKWHILEAVKVHTKGGTEESPMVTKLTVAADREQLWGPEFILRMLHHVRSEGECEVIYPEEDKSDIFSKIERIFINRFLGPLHSRNEQLRLHRGVMSQFLYLAGDEDYKKKMARLIIDSKTWLPLDENVLLKEADYFYTDIKTSGEALNILLNCKNIAPNQRFINEAIQRVMEVPVHLNKNLAKAIMFVEKAKKEEEVRIKKSLHSLIIKFRKNHLLYHIALTLHDNI